jgi:predicted hotdog family 3-hydroxylacyl-ACP dehydratase
MINEKDIHSLIPQRAPFIMVDELLFSDDKLARTSLLITAENIFVVNGEFREPGLVENIAQSAAARIGYISKMENKPVPVGYIGSVKNLEIIALPKINDQLETEISIENQIFDVTIITGKIMCKKKLVAHCEMKIFINQ